MKCRYLSGLLTICACIILACTVVPQRASAISEDITISLDGTDVAMAVQPRYDNGQVMVPMKALTNALGGISTDVSVTLYSYPCAALNECGIVFSTASDSYFTLPLSPEDLPFQSMDGMPFSDLIKMMERMLYSGQIGIDPITFPYENVPGDIYLPLSIYARMFRLSYVTNGGRIDFRRDYVEYQNPAFLSSGANIRKQELTFGLELPSKTYDGKQYSWDYNALSIYCNGQKFTGHVPELRYTYWDVGRPNGTRSSQPPTQAGMYHLIVSVDSNDAEYTGTGEFAFYITEVEVILAAENVTITAGDALPTLPFTVRRLSDNSAITNALVEEPRLTVQGGFDYLSTAGKYDIVINGGKASDNYIIVDRVGARLTVNEANSPLLPPADLPATKHAAYINGYEDGAFHPEDPLTRGACAVMLYNVAEVPDGSGTVFSDVDNGAWYYKAVRNLAAANVIKGYTDHTFRPNNCVTRAEFVAMVLRLFEVEANHSGKCFSDVPSSFWGADYIQTAAGLGFISGYVDGTFRPEQSITRAEAVSILNRITGRDTCGFTAYSTYFPDVTPRHWAYDAILRAANDHNHR